MNPSIHTTKDAASKPISLKAGRTENEGRIRLQWNSTDDEALFHVEFADWENDGAVQWTPAGYTPAKSIIVQGLQPHSDYWFRISAIHGDSARETLR